MRPSQTTALARLEVLRRITNTSRAVHGLDPLRDDVRLGYAALQHAERMRNLGFFAHEDPFDGTLLGERLEAAGGGPFGWAGENLALCDDDAERAVRLWLDSPGHRANLLHSSATHCGQAAARASDGRVFWVQIYAQHARVAFAWKVRGLGR